MNNFLNITQLAQDVFDGTEDPLKAYGLAKDYLKVVTDSVKAIEEAALDEAAKYEKTFIHEGFKFEKRNGAKVRLQTPTRLGAKETRVNRDRRKI
jgi:hypothetical protein